jgi:hypothetical protein
MIIELQGGQKIEVANGATPSQIDEVISHVSAVPTAAAAPITPSEPTSALESIGRGYAQGATLGYSDEGMGAIGALYARYVRPDLFADQSFSDSYKQGRNIARQQEAQAQASNPGLYGGAQLVGTVATGSKIPMPAGTVPRYATGAAIGGVASYGASDSDTRDGQLLETGLGALAGIGGTYVGDKIGKGIAALSNSGLAKGAKQEVQSLLSRFYTPQVAKAAATPVSPAVVNAMQKGATPEQAAILAKAQQFNIPLSRGDVVRTPEQQGIEDLALRGALTPEAADAARVFRSQQEQAMRDAAKDVTGRISGAPYVDNLADAGAMLDPRLKALKASDKANVTSQYDLVPRTGVEIQAQGFEPLNVPIKELNNRDLFDLDQMPMTKTALQRINRDIPSTAPPQPGQSSILDASGNPFDKQAVPESVTLGKYENLKRYLGNLKNSATTDTDRMGVDRLMKAANKSLDNSIEKNFVVGDQAGISQLKTATKTARDYFQRWKADDAVQKIVENNYTPEQVVNLVRGYGQTGGNKQAAQLVSKLGGILGKDSPEFSMLKQAQLRQIFGKNLDSLLEGDVQKGFSAEEVRKNLSNLVNNNRSLANEYFSKEDQQVLKDFLDVSYRATNRVPGAVNYSNTTPALIRWTRQFANQFGMLGRLAGAPVEIAAGGMASIKRGAEAQKAIESFGPQFSNPDNPLAVALRSRLASTGAASGAGYSGQSTASKREPLRLTIRPPKNAPSTNQQQVGPQSYNALLQRFYS